MSQRLKTTTAIATAVLAAMLFGSAAAHAGATDLKVTKVMPDRVYPGGRTRLWVNVQNVSSSPLSGEITVKYRTPAFELFFGEAFTPPASFSSQSCSTTPDGFECVISGIDLAPGALFQFFSIGTVPPGTTGPVPMEIEVIGPGGDPPIVLQQTFSPDPLGPFAVERFAAASAGAGGLPESRAGSNPVSLTNEFELPAEGKAFLGGFIPYTSPQGYPRNIVIHVPAGLVARTQAAPACSADKLAVRNLQLGTPSCPRESQVGWVRLDQNEVPFYNVEPPPGAPAAFGFNFESVPVTAVARLRPTDNGVDLVTKAPAAVAFSNIEASLWGVPADGSYDSWRGECLNGPAGQVCASSRPREAFLRMPTSCSGEPLRWGLELDTYEEPGSFVAADASSPALTGCDVLPFDPTLSMRPVRRAAGAPSGFDVDLSMPQDAAPEGLAEADVRSVEMTLPQGVSLNPGAADGLQACSDAELRLGLDGPSQCPAASKLGAVTVSSPLLDHPIDGAVVVRSQASQEPESGDLYRVAVELRSDRDGVFVKLPGSLRVNSQTGQLTAVFRDLPQLPFSSFQLHLQDGPGAPLTTPPDCGAYTTHAELTSWARPGESVPLDSSFSIDQGCGKARFEPGFQAGVADADAGAFSPFSLRVTREDGQPNIARIGATLPAGELAKLAGVGICPEAGAVTGACPASSQVGTTTVGVGAGSNPLYVPQAGHSPTAVYLAGPYKGGPYSIVVKVPAQAGPFDLGTVSVRSALWVDPSSAQVTVQSDPLPQIIGGVPVSYRDVRVNVDRPDFALNPTSCEPKSVDGAVSSTRGEIAQVSDHFQVHDCAALGFGPRLSLALAGATHRGAHPALSATLRMRGGANIARASVALPHSAFLDQAHIKTICTRVQFAADGGGGAGCPAASVYGRARAFTPLLDQPLEGPVYLRSSSHKLPDLVAALDGAIHVDLAGRIDTFRGGIRTSFEAVPDAPVSKFVLTMRGGQKGLIQNSRNLCLGANRADARFDGQNGKFEDFKPLVRPTSCAGKARGKHRRG